MANLSDAGVDIVVEKVGKELLNYINVTNENPTDYAIVYDGFNEHVNQNGDFVISGSSSGRWAYSNNLEGYFNPERIKNWLGVGDDYKWLDDESKRKQYQDQSAKQYTAYLELVEALKRTNGRIEINYTDCDPSMDWMGTGVFTMSGVKGEVEFTEVFDEESLNIAKYAEINGYSEYEAIEYLHGDEASEAYNKYLKTCKKEGREPASVNDWYEHIYEEE